MTIERVEWDGLVRSRRDPTSPMILELAVTPSPAGGAGTFPAVASDNQRWWVKPQNNLQGPKVVVTESLVASVGRLIRAPVCDVAIVRIPEELAGWEFRPSAQLEP